MTSKQSSYTTVLGKDVISSQKGRAEQLLLGKELQDKKLASVHVLPPPFCCVTLSVLLNFPAVPMPHL